jgi:predicted nucleic acid-binding protein
MDFEDCLQMECAKRVNADYIVTRDLPDFSNSNIAAISPMDFINKFI